MKNNREEREHKDNITKALLYGLQLACKMCEQHHYFIYLFFIANCMLWFKSTAQLAPCAASMPMYDLCCDSSNQETIVYILSKSIGLSSLSYTYEQNITVRKTPTLLFSSKSVRMSTDFMSIFDLEVSALSIIT